MVGERQPLAVEKKGKKKFPYAKSRKGKKKRGQKFHGARNPALSNGRGGLHLAVNKKRETEEGKIYIWRRGGRQGGTNVLVSPASEKKELFLTAKRESSDSRKRKKGQIGLPYQKRLQVLADGTEKKDLDIAMKKRGKGGELPHTCPTENRLRTLW